MEEKNSQTISTTSHDNNLLDLSCHYQFENGSSQFLFLDVNQNEKGGTFLNQSLSFSVENFVQTLALCNDLILLSSYSSESTDQSCYYVFNPITKQSTMIPQPSIHGYVVSVGLASNDDNNHFKVVLIEAHPSKLIDGLVFHIFSSDDTTNKWKKVSHHYIDITLPSLPEFEFKELCIRPLYSNGSIHWEIGGYLLVYDVGKDNCELIELPNVFEDWSWQSTMTYRRCLCESGGCVYYCYTDFDGFHIWKLLEKNHNLGSFYDVGPFYDSKKFRWKLVQSVMHDVFVSKHKYFLDTFFKWEPNKIAPIAYSEKAQIIYLQIPGAVVGYNFDTGKLRSICRYSYQDMNFNCCSFFSTFAFGTHNVLSGKDLVTKGEMMGLTMCLPIEEIEKLSF